MEEELIVNNMGLVYMQLHKMNLAYDDEAFSYAMEGLMNASRTYDNSKSIQFSTYASVCIYNAVQMLIRKRNAKRQLNVVSYDEPLFDDGTTCLDMLVGTDDLEEAYIRREYIEAVKRTIDRLLSDMKLNNKKRVIQAWCESDFEKPHTVIAEEVGVSQSYATQAIKAFQHKLKKELEDYL